ncbi:MAG: nitroreductase family protein [Chloroflexi bacterium]|nr:nitroreductase family protein [Chloroflexota bacterium]
MNIDEFLELARARRSVRRFKSDPVPDELIEKIIEAARWAMSGANGQPWEFIVVKDPALKDKIAEAKDEQQRLAAAIEMTRVPEMRQPRYRGIPDIPPDLGFREAPVLIFVCADPRTIQATVLNQLLDRRWLVDENTANATQMLHLAAAACGLGAQWVTISAYLEDMIKPILGAPKIIRILNMVPIGYPAYQPKMAYRRELKEIIHYDGYDMSKYRSHEQLQDFLLQLRELSKPVYPIK